MATSLKLILPNGAPDRFARTSILDQDLVIIHQNAPGILQPSVHLEPGIYAARTVLTDGTQFQAAFEVNESDREIEVKLKNITAARDRMSARRSVTEDHASLEEEKTAPNDNVNIVLHHDADIVFNKEGAGREPIDIASMSLALVDANGQVQDIGPMPASEPDVLQVEPGPLGRFVRITSTTGEPDRFIAAPTSPSESAEIRIQAGNPTNIVVKLGDERADLLLHYLEAGRIGQVSDIIADHWPKVEALLSLGSRRLSEFSNLVNKHLPQVDALVGEGSTRLGDLAKLLVNSDVQQGISGGVRAVYEMLTLVLQYQPQVEALLAARRASPITATVAAYAVLLVGPPMGKDGKPTRISDLMNLCADFLFVGAYKSSDDLCICAELFARQGKHTEALGLLLELPRRPAPMFTYGLRFALDRLNAYRNAAVAGKLEGNHVAEIEAALEQLAPLASVADFSRAVLMFEAVPEMAEPHVLSSNSSLIDEVVKLEDVTMPTSSPQEQAFPKSAIADDDLVKEFATGNGLDDRDAYLETRESDDFQTLEDTPSWRPAKALKTLQSQVNQTFPNRKKTSDGMIGDSAHCPGSSDHCANIVDGGVGVVTAFDITHDPVNGCDMANVTAAVIGSRDPRIKYIIYNSRICSSYAHGGTPAWTWRPYSGSNPHDKHAHFSVAESKSLYDSTDPWTIVNARNA